jgi:hypothetical protein
MGFRSISYLGLIGVGVCSAGYHMTLKYHTQMCMFQLATQVITNSRLTELIFSGRAVDASSHNTTALPNLDFQG